MLDPEPPVRPLVAIRSERPADPADVEAIRAVLRAAFPTEDEADLVDRLRATGELDPERSLLAVVEGKVVGHCLLTATTLEHPDGTRIRGRVLALGPMAVLPAWQRRHVGTQLMHAALERSERDGAAAVVLVGSPTYYARFGFGPARRMGLLPPGHWRDEVWMARPLPARTPADVGVVWYAPPFLDLGQA
ncbi:MAG TPA: N-acetyltransferase [Patescibacteria group bacterium]|nr:N-acetyltransferase [Patescibacteria group bacterium]